MEILKQSKNETRHGWHFLPADGRVTRLGTLVEVGTIERHEGDLRPCVSGLHFSERPIDSLQYAPGPVLHEVKVSGRIVMDTDKGVAEVRETLWVDDVTPMLRAFARWCAWSVRDKWNPPVVVLEYLVGGAATEANRIAAWAAARADAGDAAWAAAWAAAGDAAGAAAGAAAWAAAWAAAGDAAGAAARAAAWAAAWDAARADAGDAARLAQNDMLINMISEFRAGKRIWKF